MGENPDRRVVRGKMNTDAEFADSLPVGLPSGLLQRRPDVRSSAQRLRSAMASAGMAYADRFPRLTFNLTGGLENDDLSGFFRSPFSYVAGTLASPIFGFGRKQARYRAACRGCADAYRLLARTTGQRSMWLRAALLRMSLPVYKAFLRHKGKAASPKN